MGDPVRAPVSALATLPLVGRERERALLRERFAAASAGRGGLVLVGGEAGIGKTCFVDRFIQLRGSQAGGRTVRVLKGNCDSLFTPTPLGPLYDIARQMQAARPFSDWTVSRAALLRGRRLEAVVRAAFGAARIEDLWRPFFCNACDIARFEDVVHARGSVTDAALSSCALPGVFAPRRHGEALLIDGGTTDLLPTAAMRARCEGPLIAVDVSGVREIDAARPVSAREVFWRAADLDAARRLRASAAHADCFLRPPVEDFATDALHALEAIARRGYVYARARLAAGSTRGAYSISPERWA